MGAYVHEYFNLPVDWVRARLFRWDRLIISILDHPKVRERGDKVVQYGVGLD
jgi:hypothetical protein